MKRKNPKVDAFIQSASAWRKETEALRAICLGCGLNEEFKWSKPCYTFGESNVVLIQGFNEFCALLFCKGVLLRDPEGILHRIGEHTQAARQARFTDVRDITALKPALEASILEAIEVEKSGARSRRIPKGPSAIRGLEGGVWRPDARPTAGLYPAYFVGQAVVDTGVARRKMPRADSLGKRAQ